MRQNPLPLSALLGSMVSLAVAGLVLNGCAADASRPDPPDPLATVAGPGLDLPAPGELPKSTSYTPQSRIKPGIRFDPDLPWQRTFGACGYSNMEPDCDPAAPTIDGLAFAFYHFSLSGYDEEPVITLDWVVPPADPNDCYLGLPDWDRNCWDWYRTGADWTLEFPALADLLDHFDPDGQCYVVLALAGESTAQLNWIRIGGRVGYWYKETAHAGLIDWPSLALDAKDQPHIAFRDSDMNGLRYLWFDGIGWDSELVGDFALGGITPCLDLDSAGQPHIAHQVSESHQVLYSFKSSEGWVGRIVETGCEASAYPALVISDGGTPFISYYQSSTMKVKVAFGPPGFWFKVDVEDELTVGARISIAQTSDLAVHIGYYDSTNKEVHYATLQALEVTQSVVSVSNADSYPFLALGPADQIYLALRTDLPNCIFQVARLQETGWDFSAYPPVGASTSNSLGGCSSMAVATDGLPHLAYTDSTDDGLWYARYDGLVWEKTSIDSVELDPTTSICLDSHGRPVIAYTEDENEFLLVARLLD